MAKKNNVLKNIVNNFIPEKLSMNPVKRSAQKKRNEIKKVNAIALVSVGAAGVAGTVAGTTIGYHKGKKNTRKMVTESFAEYGLNEAVSSAVLDGSAPKDILEQTLGAAAIADSDDEDDDSDPVGAICINPNLTPNDYVVGVDGNPMPGFSLNGSEEEHVVTTLLYGHGLMGCSEIRVFHPYSSNELGRAQGDVIKRFADDNGIDVVEIDSDTCSIKTVRDPSVDENGNIVYGDTEDDAEESDSTDPFAGMNSVTSQLPSSEEPKGSEIEVGHIIRKAPDDVDPSEIDAFFFKWAADLLMKEDPSIQEEDIGLNTEVSGGFTILDVAYSRYVRTMQKLAERNNISDPVELKKEFDRLMAEYHVVRDQNDKPDDTHEEQEERE